MVCAYNRPETVDVERYDNQGRSTAATIAVDPDWLVSFEQNYCNSHSQNMVATILNHHHYRYIAYMAGYVALK